jgi:3-dehydroquinate synthase
MIRTVSVGRGTPDAYDVLIGSRLLDRAGERLAPLAPGGRISVLTDRCLADHHGERLTAALEAGGLAAELIVVTDDPGHPVVDPGPGDLVAVFGGDRLGAIAASLTPLLARGAGLVRIPTSLRGQIDCVVGAEGPSPRLAICDADVLATLPPDKARAGYGAALKYALAADSQLLGWLEAHLADILALKAPALAHAVAGGVEAKVALLHGPSPRPEAVRLGEDFGRALMDVIPTLPAAEAASVGCALAFQLSSALRLCSADDAERATWSFAAAGLPVRLEEVADGALADGLRGPSGRIDLVLARGLGQAFLSQGVDERALHDFLIAEGTPP